jgi:hypothetical protein
MPLMYNFMKLKQRKFCCITMTLKFGNITAAVAVLLTLRFVYGG